MDKSRVDSKSADAARFLIRIYQWLTVGVPHRCRFAPSCSEYMREAMSVRGFWMGLAVGSRRILNCHPWHPGGYDPVKD